MSQPQDTPSPQIARPLNPHQAPQQVFQQPTFQPQQQQFFQQPTLQPPQEPSGMSTSIVGGSKLLQMIRRPTRQTTIKEKMKLVGYGVIAGLIIAVLAVIGGRHVLFNMPKTVTASSASAPPPTPVVPE